MDAHTDLGDRYALRFMKIALLYMLLAITWMAFTPLITEPASPFGQQVYGTAVAHVANIGWIAFTFVALYYYVVPRITGNGVHSEKLASWHFWITNVAWPVGLLDVLYFSYSLPASYGMDVDITTTPYFVYLQVFLLLGIIGIIGQILFVYNVWRTMSPAGDAAPPEMAPETA